MTRKVFWEDSYLTALETTVASVDHNEVTVAETIFYAFSGGQESDEGTIGGFHVLEARKEGKELVYKLEDDHGLIVGDRVVMSIDWTRRYRLMRLHFAAEIVLELVYQNYLSAHKIGAHIAQDKSRIDFEWGENISILFPILEEEASRLIEIQLSHCKRVP